MDDQDDVAGYEIVMPFLANDPNWAHGFEAGKLYAEMQAGAPEIVGMYHRVNDEQIFLMARHFDYARDWKRVDDTWIDVALRKR